jgi:hypothetical protein
MVILRSLSFQGVVSQFPPEMQLFLKIREINKTTRILIFSLSVFFFVQPELITKASPVEGFIDLINFEAHL